MISSRYILIMLLLLFKQAAAQQPTEPDLKTQEKIENIVEKAGEDADLNTLLDYLEYFREHPLNLNTATEKDLLDLTLLNDLQIDALLTHIEKNGKLIA